MKYTAPNLGFEATYRFSPQMGWIQDIIDKEDDSFMNSLINSDKMCKKLDGAKLSLFSYMDMDIDDANIELKTEIVEPSERKKLYSQFDRLNKVLSQFYLVPSTQSHNSNMEGGGHIHLDFDENARRYMLGQGVNPLGYPNSVYYYKFVGLMLRNLNKLANHFPALIWAMNSPYDNINAKSTLWNEKFDDGTINLCSKTSHLPSYVTSDYDLGRKCYCITYRQHFQTFEFRFFSMPKDGDGLKLNVSIAESMYKKAFDLTIADTTFVPQYTDKRQLCKITSRQAISNLKEAAKYLGLDYNDFVKQDRVKSLRKRFQLEATHNPNGDINQTYLN